MEEFSYSITNIAATLAGALGISKPAHAEMPVGFLADYFTRELSGLNAERMLLFSPDSIAAWLIPKYGRWFGPVYKHTRITVPLRAVLPSVTPVCFASIYSGAAPDVHGIREYCKPVLTVDTLFDALIRAGKRVAIFARTDCSMAKIFLNRDMDYHIYDSDRDITKKAAECIKNDNYDVMAVYHLDYDAFDHATHPESDEVLAALQASIKDFDFLANIAAGSWSMYRRVIGFITDHGCHMDEITGHGTHGSDMDEDLNILHFYGAYPCI